MSAPDDPAGIDRLIHEPSRLAILTVLSSTKEADFVFLQRSTRLTNGNRKAYRTVVDRTVGSTLSRADLAAATLIAAGDPATIGHAIGVGY